MWVRKWKCSDKVPTKLVDALKSCDEIQFPNIFVLLKLTLMLPVTGLGTLPIKPNSEEEGSC